MFLLSRKQIEIKEYSNVSISTDRAHKREINIGSHRSLTFNCARLTYALARTLSSSYLTYHEFLLDVIGSCITLRNVVSDTSPAFRLKDSRLNSLRDFTRSSKVGEIAQAIAYLFSQDHLDRPVVVDFHQYFVNRGLAVPSKDTTPDFIIHGRLLDGNISLLESKGTEINTSSVKGMLKNGLTQCSNGSSISAAHGFNVTNKYVACTELSVDSMADNTTIHYVDPEQFPKSREFDDSILRMHYASWFYLVSDFENCDRLVRGDNIEINSNLYSNIDFEGESYLVKKNTISNLIFNTGRKSTSTNFIGISTRIVDLLSGQRTFKELPFFKNSSENTLVNLFADGTIVSVGQFGI